VDVKTILAQHLILEDGSQGRLRHPLTATSAPRNSDVSVFRASLPFLGVIVAEFRNRVLIVEKLLFSAMSM
jgi:hypothetical protein